MTSNLDNITITGIDSYDKPNIDAKLLTINTDITNKQATLSNTTEVTNCKTLLIGNKIKNLVPGDKINFTSTDNSITINGIDAYTKAETAIEIGKLVNGAPAVLDTLKEIADFIGDSTTISGNLINLISTKSNSSDTFLKSVVNTNDISLSLSSNKRLLGTSTANQFKFQILDNQGTTFTDAWIDVGIIEFNITTKKAKFTVKDALFIDSTDVLTTLNNKLSITDPKITQSAVKFSSVSIGPDTITPDGAYNYLNCGTVGLSIKADSSTISTMFFGSSAGAQKGNVRFYKDVDVTGDLKVGTTNILTEINNKLSITDPKITQTASNFSSVSIGPDTITPDGAYNYLHTATVGLSVKVDSSTISAMFFGSSAGSQKGDVQFYKNVGVTGTLKVGSTNILTELATKTSLTNTFEKTILNNDVYLTLSDNKRIVSTATGNQIKFQINDNQGTTFTDAWIDVGIMDFNITTKKAKLTVKDSLFVDAIDIITTLNNKVNTTALSSYANLTTTTLQTFLGEIKAPIITLGTTNLLNTAASWTSGASNATHTLNVGPNWLSVNTTNRVAFEVMGAINGVADEGQTQFFYNVTVPKLTVQTEGLNSMGDLTISRSAPTGNGNVKTSIINSGQDGFSSLYLNTTNQTINETGQLFVGQQSGLTLMTRTNHSIQFKAYSDQPATTVPTSMKILANETRDVEIYTRLLIKGSDTIVDNNIVVNGDIMCSSIKPQGSGGLILKKLDGSNAFKVSANGITQFTENIIAAKNITIGGDLTVTGNTTFTQANPHWIAVVIVYLAGVPSIGRNGGRYPITSLRRVSGFAAGVFEFDFPEHPYGTGYIVSITASAGYGTVYASSRSSTRFGVTTRNISNVFFDTETHITISAY